MIVLLLPYIHIKFVLVSLVLKTLLWHSVVYQVVDLQSRFKNLFCEITEVLSERQMNCKDIIDHLLNTPPERIGEHFTVILKNMTQNIPLDEFIIQMKKYMRFLDYKLLKEMASVLASNQFSELLNKVENYESDIISFCRTTSISSYAKSCPILSSGSEAVPEHFIPIQVHHQLNPDVYTLRDLEEWRQSFSKGLKPGFAPAYIGSAMILFKVELAKESQYITWLIPTEIVPYLMAAKLHTSNAKFFVEQKIELLFDTHKSDTSGSTSPTSSSKNNHQGKHHGDSFKKRLQGTSASQTIA